MAWTSIDQQTTQAVQAAGPPPGSAADMMGDGAWLQLFTRWAGDTGRTDAANTATWAASYDMPLSEMDTTFVQEGAPLQCPWPDNVPTLVGANMGVNDDGAKSQMWGIAGEMLAAHYGDFVDDVGQLQVVISGPQAIDIGRDQLDEAVIQGINEANLKGARNEGDTLQYWQADDILLIGTGHPASYYEWCNAQNGAAEGTITVVSRGGPLSTGKIEVTSCPDEDLFKRRLREFSKKKIDFVGGGDDEVEEEAAPLPDTVQECLNSEQWYDTFADWTRTQAAGENIDFLEAVDRYRGAQTREWARYIWDEFLQVGAPNQVTIDNDVIVQAIYEKLSDQTNPDDLGADLFDAASGEVERMLEGLYSRFQVVQGGG